MQSWGIQANNSNEDHTVFTIYLLIELLRIGCNKLADNTRKAQIEARTFNIATINFRR